MSPLKIRRATLDDLPFMLQMYANSKNIMRSNGNHSQWVAGYPSEQLLRDDILHGFSFLVTDDSRPVGVFAFIIGRDPTYTYIEGGHWEQDAQPYGTIHRMACMPDAHGIFAAAIDWCRRQTTSLRIDTHADNSIMQHLIVKHGFTYRGVIYIADGTPRKAYQLLPSGALCEPLKDYVCRQILPRYDHFDPAHRQDHANAVINNSLALASHYPVDINMVYTIAAYHDTGLCEGRERHHIVSKEILLSDNNLHQWFSPEQLQTMGDAIEDHRASAVHAPRTIYGKIVAEADRDISPLKIIRRTVQFGLGHYPELPKEQQWQRALSHLQEKYGSSGYLTLWVPESPNKAQLDELRRLIADPSTLRALFEKYYIEETRSS